MHNLIFMYNRLCYIGKIWEEGGGSTTPYHLRLQYSKLHVYWELFSFFSVYKVFYLERGGGGLDTLLIFGSPLAIPYPLSKTIEFSGIKKDIYCCEWNSLQIFGDHFQKIYLPLIAGKNIVERYACINPWLAWQRNRFDGEKMKQKTGNRAPSVTLSWSVHQSPVQILGTFFSVIGFQGPSRKRSRRMPI